MNFKYLYYKLVEGITYRYGQLSKKYPKFKRNLMYTLACLLLILLGIAIYFIYFAKEKEVEEKQEMITVKVKKAVKEDYKDTYTVMGTIKGAVENEMRFELDGQLAAFNYKEGDMIEKGMASRWDAFVKILNFNDLFPFSFSAVRIWNSKSAGRDTS